MFSRKEIIKYFRGRERLEKKFSSTQERLKELTLQLETLENQLGYARKVTEVYRRVPLHVRQEKDHGDVYVVTDKSYAHIDLYITRSKKPRCWNFCVIYRADGTLRFEKLEVFWNIAAPEEKEKAFKVAKDLAVVLAGGKGTKLAQELASKVHGTFCLGD